MQGSPIRLELVANVTIPFLEVGMKSLLLRFVRDTSGATAIEYGLIAAGISVAIITVVNTLGGQLVNTFSSVSDQLKNAGN
jgi:pilus assembly protein Flp/PilA